MLVGRIEILSAALVKNGSSAAKRIARRLSLNRKIIGRAGLKQFANRLCAVINERKRPGLRPGQMRFQIKAQAVEDSCNNFRWFDRPLDRITAYFIALAYNATAPYSASGKIHGPALRPMVASTCRIDFWRASKFSETRNQGSIQ